MSDPDPILAHCCHKIQVEVGEWFVGRPEDDVAIASAIVDPATDLPSEANARLIAAAPELLAVVEEFVRRWDDDSVICDPCDDGLADMARLAIAKAKGDA